MMMFVEMASKDVAAILERIAPLMTDENQKHLPHCDLLRTACAFRDELMKFDALIADDQTKRAA